MITGDYISQDWHDTQGNKILRKIVVSTTGEAYAVLPYARQNQYSQYGIAVSLRDETPFLFWESTDENQHLDSVFRSLTEILQSEEHNASWVSSLGAVMNENGLILLPAGRRYGLMFRAPNMEKWVSMAKVILDEVPTEEQKYQLMEQITGMFAGLHSHKLCWKNLDEDCLFWDRRSGDLRLKSIEKLFSMDQMDSEQMTEAMEQDRLAMWKLLFWLIRGENPNSPPGTDCAQGKNADGIQCGSNLFTEWVTEYKLHETTEELWGQKLAEIHAREKINASRIQQSYEEESAENENKQGMDADVSADSIPGNSSRPMNLPEQFTSFYNKQVKYLESDTQTMACIQYNKKLIGTFLCSTQIEDPESEMKLFEKMLNAEILSDENGEDLPQLILPVDVALPSEDCRGYIVDINLSEYQNGFVWLFKDVKDKPVSFQNFASVMNTLAEFVKAVFVLSGNKVTMEYWDGHQLFWNSKNGHFRFLLDRDHYDSGEQSAEAVDMVSAVNRAVAAILLYAVIGQWPGNLRNRHLIRCPEADGDELKYFDLDTKDPPASLQPLYNEKIWEQMPEKLRVKLIEGNRNPDSISLEDWEDFLHEMSEKCTECYHCGEKIPEGVCVCHHCGTPQNLGKCRVQIRLINETQPRTLEFVLGRNITLYGCNLSPELPAQPFTKLKYNGILNKLALQNLSGENWMCTVEQSTICVQPGEILLLSKNTEIALQDHPGTKLRILDFLNTKEQGGGEEII